MLPLARSGVPTLALTLLKLHMLTSHPHTPNHLFLDRATYFVTGAIYQKRHLLLQPTCKELLLQYIREYCPRNEQDTIIRTNYLFYNPIKHGYVKDVRLYPYSSFHNEVETRGRAELANQFQTYPEYKTFILHEAQKNDF